MMERIAGATAVAWMGLTLAGCGQADGMQVQESPEETVRTVNVEVVEVQPQDFTNFIQLVGTVEAERDVTVAAEESGVVESLATDKGAKVSAGQTLVQLDGAVLQAQLDQAESQAALAAETWQRQKQLWEDDSVGTEIQYLQAKYNAETAAAQARVLRERMARTAVRAPIAGILDARLVEVGSMVAAGSPVGRVLDVDTVKVTAGVPERYASEVQPGAGVLVNVDALQGREYRGRVDFVGAAVDRDDRTFEVEIVVPNPGLGIKPGMVANVQIARRTIQDALAVPRHAVLRQESGYVVFVARQTDGGWQAESRAVTLGASRDNYVVVTDGLEAGERVVTVGQQQVAEGDMLRVTNNEVVSAPELDAAGADGGER
jgi:membrane fusion protein (multidrug efflux system)